MRDLASLIRRGYDQAVESIFEGERKMNGRILQLLIAAIAALFLVGCANTYQTNASDTQLSAYAGQAVYPRQIDPVEAPHLFCTIGKDATINLYNTGDDTYADFELWVNQLYTLHVVKLEPRGTIAISPATMYNKTGGNLAGVPGNSINTVQVFSQGKLLTVQGPIFLP